MDEETQVNLWQRTSKPLQDQVRTAVVWIAVIALAVGTIMLLVALNQVVTVWFRYQYIPFARASMGLAIMAGALAVIWRLAVHRRS